DPLVAMVDEARPVLIDDRGEVLHLFLCDHDVRRAAAEDVLDPCARGAHRDGGGPRGVCGADLDAVIDEVQFGGPAEAHPGAAAAARPAPCARTSARSTQAGRCAYRRDWILASVPVRTARATRRRHLVAPAATRWPNPSRRHR